MSKQERIYCKLTPGGFSDKAVSEFIQEFTNIRNSWRAFADKHGAEKMYGGRSLLGLLFSGDEPKGWKSTSGLPKDVFRPLKKSVPEDYQEFSSLAGSPDGSDLAKSLKIDVVFSGMAMHMPTFEEVGGVVLLSLHKDSKIPDGAEPMKMSEYWSLVESEESLEV